MEHPPPRRHFRLPCSDTDTLITADRNIFTRIINNCLSRASRLLLGAVAGAAAGRGGGAADAGGDLAGQLRALLQQHRGLHRLQLRVSPELRLGR